MQIARIEGCRVVGIAGGPEKCAFVAGELGADAAIDFKAEPDLSAAIARACPDGVDLCFDNVGGPTLDAALELCLRLQRGCGVRGWGRDDLGTGARGRGARALRLHLQERLPSAVEAAEKCFHRALDVARGQGALSLELRSAMSLARLWRGQQRGSHARKLLAPVYRRFTEGLAPPISSPQKLSSPQFVERGEAGSKPSMTLSASTAPAASSNFDDSMNPCTSATCCAIRLC